MQNKEERKILLKNNKIKYIIKRYQIITSGISFFIMLLSSFHLRIFIYFFIEMIMYGIINLVSRPVYENGILKYPGYDLTKKGIISCIRDIITISWVVKVLGLVFKHSYLLYLFVICSFYYEFRYRDAPGVTRW